MANISPDISFLTSYVRGLHSKLLSIEDFENLINKPYEAFINDLTSFEIGEILRLQPSYQSHEIERILTRQLLDQYDFILRHMPKWGKEFLEAYMIKFEVMNLQRVIRYLYSKAQVDLREIINLRAQEMLGRTSFIAKLLQSEDLGVFLEKMKLTEYKKAIEVSEIIYSKVGDIWPIEFALNVHYLNLMLEEAQKLPRNQRKGALSFVHQEMITNVLLVIIKADFVEVDIDEALELISLPKDIPFRRQIVSLANERSLNNDLKILKSLDQIKLTEGIERYEEDEMFLHIEIALRARELEFVRKVFYCDFGILSILSYLKQYEAQIQDLNKLLYLKEYKFPIERTRELIVNLV
ncbi:MAG: V-type ATPase subunit [Candidatus Heimdallarchaeota archaeon]|nr:V-type ATPase subunit [Candidatus Heimdallarchaeota archaeon]MCK4610002.1 V-type ATPase subunit [Candidatus Heimdallarchaeota archaeon]